MPVLTRDYALSIPDPALASLWVVKVPTDFGIIPPFLIAESITAVFPKISAESRHSAAGFDFFPNFLENDSISLTLFETHNHLVRPWLKAWRDKVFDNSQGTTQGTYGLPSVYKKPIVLALYSKYSKKPVKVITYNGCWPTDTAPYELNYQDENARVTVQATFSVDSVSD